MAEVNITGLNFDEIKNNIKVYLRNQAEFKDYNFEGSVISRLIDLLAYNTYYNSYYVNMIGNEMFLDTAKIRENVVSNAKKLDYVPNSNQSAQARIKVNVIAPPNVAEVTVPKYAKFVTTLNGKKYHFITKESHFLTNELGTFIKDIDIFEGLSYTYTYTYDGVIKFFEIPDDKVDINSLRVYIRESSSVTDRIEYKKANNVVSIGRNDEVYYIQENSNGKYEIYFGSDIIGKSLSVGNIIEIEAILCNGEEANGARQFKPEGLTAYNSLNNADKFVPAIDIINPAEGGSNRESIEKIKYSAPKQYTRQNRLVSVNDYESFILDNFSDIQAVSVWGGEDNVIPIYGRVLVSVKPKSSYVTSSFRKEQITNILLKNNTIGLEPIVVDPKFSFINIESIVYYDSNKSILKANEIFNKVSTTIQEYELTDLGTFNKEFFLSKLMTKIDSSDSTIISNDTKMKVEKRITPIYNTKVTYKMQFNAKLYRPYPRYKGTMMSTGFYLNNSPTILPQYLEDDGNGNVVVYYMSAGKKIIIKNIGKIDYEAGEIIINSFDVNSLVDDQNELRILVEPNKNNYKSKHNEILLFSYPNVSLYDTTTNETRFKQDVSVLASISPISSNYINGTYTL
jgi:hypothetical protein